MMMVSAVSGLVRRLAHRIGLGEVPGLPILEGLLDRAAGSHVRLYPELIEELDGGGAEERAEYDVGACLVDDLGWHPGTSPVAAGVLVVLYLSGLGIDYHVPLRLRSEEHTSELQSR